MAITLGFAQRWLLVTSIVLALQGVSWVIMGSFDPWGIYDGMLSQALLQDDDLPHQAVPFLRFAIRLLGATDAAFFVLFALIVKYAFSCGEPWAHTALTAGLLTWFSLDSALSISVNAWFNVLLVNLPCLVQVGTPLLLSRNLFYPKHESKVN